VLRFLRLGSEQYIIKKNRLNRCFYRLLGSHGLLPKMSWYHVLRRVDRLKPDRRQPLLVLDAGSGSGGCAFALRRTRRRAFLVCLDAVWERLRECKTIQRHCRVSGITLVLADLQHLPFSGAFDVVYSIDTLEHIPDDIGALRNLRDALRDDGVLILHVPRSRFEQKTILPVARKIPRHVCEIATNHVRTEYLDEEIRQKLLEAGFAVQEFGYAQGTLGRLAFEINSLCLTRLNIRNVLAMLTYPLTTILGYLDAILPHRTGNAFVIVATKPGHGNVRR